MPSVLKSKLLPVEKCIKLKLLITFSEIPEHHKYKCIFKHFLISN